MSVSDLLVEPSQLYYHSDVKNYRKHSIGLLSLQRAVTNTLGQAPYLIQRWSLWSGTHNGLDLRKARACAGVPARGV